MTRVLLLVLVAGCGGAGANLPVPLVRQANSYSCGAAALLSVLYYYQRYDGRETSLYERLATTEAEGTNPAHIVAVARSFGLHAEVHEHATIAQLRAALARREPVIVDLQAWTDDPAHVHWRDAWEDGHYVVAVGVDATRLTVMDPSTAAGYAYVSLAELADRWHDYESIDGRRVEYRNLAIFFTGSGPGAEFPRPLVRMQ